jgi:hypothetical protein
MKRGRTNVAAALRCSDGDGLQCTFSATTRLRQPNTRGRVAPHPGPDRLKASLAQPQLNHAEQRRSYAALPEDAAIPLRPGQTGNPLGPPGSGSDITDRSLSQRARSLRTMLDLGF